MSDGSQTAPPPSEALLSAVASMAPVRTRAPGRTLLGVIAGSLAAAALTACLFHWRRDLDWLSLSSLAAVAMVWFAGFVTALAAALVPPRKQVLPDPSRAALAAIGVSAAMVAASLILSLQAPGHSRLLSETAPKMEHLFLCPAIALLFAGVPIALCVIVLRRLAPVGAGRIAAAAGAAGGALGGLALQFICDIGGPLHLGVAHGGAVILCALAGALAGRIVVGGPASGPAA